MDPSQKRRISLKDLISTLVVLGLFAGIFYMGHYATSQITTLNAKNKTLAQQYEDMKNELQSLKDLNSQLLQEKNQLTTQITALNQNKKEQELANEGIDTKKVNIKKLGLNGSWDVSTFSYQLNQAYLTPAISDLSVYTQGEGLKDMHFLVVEVGVADNRTSGGQISVPVNDYFTLVDGNLTSQPFTDDDLIMLPGEQKTVYVSFAVEPSSYQFELRSGYEANPVVNELDFESTGAQSVYGIFMLMKGYAPEYVN